MVEDFAGWLIDVSDRNDDSPLSRLRHRSPEDTTQMTIREPVLYHALNRAERIACEV
jgi:hypothetical protein